MGANAKEEIPNVIVPENVILSMARVAIGYRCDNMVDFQFKDMSIRSIDPSKPLHVTMAKEESATLPLFNTHEFNRFENIKRAILQKTEESPFLIFATQHYSHDSHERRFKLSKANRPPMMQATLQNPNWWAPLA